MEERYLAGGDLVPYGQMVMVVFRVGTWSKMYADDRKVREALSFYQSEQPAPKVVTVLLDILALRIIMHVFV